MEELKLVDIRSLREVVAAQICEDMYLKKSRPVLESWVESIMEHAVGIQSELFSPMDSFVALQRALDFCQMELT